MLQSFGHLLFTSGVRSRLIGKDPDAEKDWRQDERGTTEDKMVGWLQWLDGHEFEQAPGVADGQGSLLSCSPWGLKELDDWVTELNWTEAEEIKKWQEYTEELYKKGLNDWENHDV